MKNNAMKLPLNLQLLFLLFGLLPLVLLSFVKTSTFAQPSEVPDEVLNESAQAEKPISDRDMPIEETAYKIATESAAPVVSASGEKLSPLDPVLLLDASDELDELAREEDEKSETIIGLLKIEEHPIDRRLSVRRWVLETASGTRIPLKSSLAFIMALKKEGILDQPVRLTGVWRPSWGDERLRFFDANRIEPLEDKDFIKRTSLASDTANASETMPLQIPKIASPAIFVSYEDELMEDKNKSFSKPLINLGVIASETGLASIPASLLYGDHN